MRKPNPNASKSSTNKQSAPKTRTGVRAGANKVWQDDWLAPV